MIIRKKIKIDNHPFFSNIKREAQVFRTYKEYDTNRVILLVLLFHYDENDNLLTYFPGNETSPIELIGENKTKVNPLTGQKVLPNEDETYPEGTIGEFEYLWNIAEQKQLTEAEMEDMYILLRINEINKQAYKL
jgi:hypothetical protein